jgi:hypothetical protein
LPSAIRSLQYRVARHRKEERFTALVHHLNVDTLRTAFLALKRKAAPGVDGVAWQDYEADLEANPEDLHREVHRGAYRPQTKASNPGDVRIVYPKSSPYRSPRRDSILLKDWRRRLFTRPPSHDTLGRHRE